jgi:hypothetical protein
MVSHHCKTEYFESWCGKQKQVLYEKSMGKQEIGVGCVEFDSEVCKAVQSLADINSHGDSNMKYIFLSFKWIYMIFQKIS